MIAPYVGFAIGQVSGIIGATLIGAAWTGEAPRRSALVAGVGLVGLGAVLAVLSQRELRS